MINAYWALSPLLIVVSENCVRDDTNNKVEIGSRDGLAGLPIPQLVQCLD